VASPGPFRVVTADVPLESGTGRSGADSTHLAFRVLLGDLHGPRTGTRPAFQDSSWARNRREYQPAVEHHVEDLVHILEAFDLILLAKARGQISNPSPDKVSLTSSTGAKYIPFSRAYRWNSLLPWTTTSRYVLSTGTVWESLCPA
jgi:hypothetical protein